MPVDEELLDAAGDALRVVANFAVGYDNIDVDACRARGVVVTNTPDVLTNATAELAVALMLAAARRLGEAERLVRAGRWTGWEPGQLLGRELSGTIVGIVGLGRIGTRVAELLRGFDVVAAGHLASPHPEVEQRLAVERVSFDELVGRSDFVTLHVPLTAETRHLIDERRPRALQAGRDSRKHRARRAGRQRGAGAGPARRPAGGRRPRRLRERAQVPPELVELENVVLAPHIGSATATARDAMATARGRERDRGARGSRPAHPGLALIAELRPESPFRGNPGDLREANLCSPRQDREDFAPCRGDEPADRDGDQAAVRVDAEDAVRGVSRAKKPRCEDCFFHQNMLCALEDKKPCPTFRPAHPDGLRPPRQLAFVFRTRSAALRPRSRSPAAHRRARRPGSRRRRSSGCRPCRSARGPRSRTRITNEAASNTSSLCGTAEFSTSRANSIEATPFGPEPRDEQLEGLRQPVPDSDPRTAAGRATSSAKAMKATSAGMLRSQPVATISAPNRKNVLTWNTALTFSLKRPNASGTSRSTTPSVMPATNAAISPLPIVASASP